MLRTGAAGASTVAAWLRDVHGILAPTDWVDECVAYVRSEVRIARRVRHSPI